MTLKLAIVAVLAIPLLLWAFFSDRRDWTKKSDHELEGMAGGSEWKAWQPSLVELKRRGHDIEPYRGRIVEYLMSDSPHEREAARFALIKAYPDMIDSLRGYKAVDKSDQSAGIASALISQYGTGQNSDGAT